MNYVMSLFKNLVIESSQKQPGVWALSCWSSKMVPFRLKMTFECEHVYGEAFLAM